MKKTSLIALTTVLTLALLSGCNTMKKSDSEQKKMTDDPAVGDHEMMEDTDMQDEEMTGVMMEDGQVMAMWKNGMKTELKEEITLEDGTTVMVNGRLKLKDGTTRMLKEGEKIMVDNDEDDKSDEDADDMSAGMMEFKAGMGEMKSGMEDARAGMEDAEDAMHSAEKIMDDSQEMMR